MGPNVRGVRLYPVRTSEKLCSTAAKEQTMGRELMRVKQGHPWGETCREGMKPKKGDWFQMWQTVSDKPYTPAFATAEELARWCADHPWGMEKDNPIPYETWLKFINGPGWAPSMMGTAGAVTSGVEAMVDRAA